MTSFLSGNLEYYGDNVGQGEDFHSKICCIPSSNDPGIHVEKWPSPNRTGDLVAQPGGEELLGDSYPWNQNQTWTEIINSNG
jgi:hypothetical protein